MGRTASIVAFLCLGFLWLPTTALPESPAIPDPGGLGSDLYVPTLNGICGVGAQLSAGCDAIRDREIVDAAARPWRAIGRINFASIQVRQHCTGTLVSERIVLTAAHCLYNFPRKTWIPPESIRFVAGYQRGQSVAMSQGVRYILDPVQDSQSRDFRGSASQDWALLVLQDPIGQDTGFLNITHAQPQTDGAGAFGLAGYAGLRPHVLSVAHDCGPPDLTLIPKAMAQHCSSMHGDSGAPLLLFDGDKVSVVGVLSGFLSNGLQSVSVAVPAARFGDRLHAERQD